MRLQQTRLLDLKLGLDGVKLFDDSQILLDLLRADGVGPLEHHVLEEMRHAGDAGSFIDGANPGNPSSFDIRVAGSRCQQDLHPVVELVLDHRDLLGKTSGRKHDDQDEEPTQRKLCHE